MAAGDQHFPDEEPLKHSSRYLEASGDTDGDSSFINFDTEQNAGPHALTLRDADHAAGMHYNIRVTSNSTSSITVQRPAAGSTKTINGKFAGQTFSSATSLTLFKEDGVLAIRPSGANWEIYFQG